MVGGTALDSARLSSIPPDGGPILAKGATLGRYMIIEPLGRGGMGIVYAAYDPTLDRRVAVKVLKHVSLTAGEETRLLNEGMAMAKLSHPNVVAVHDVGTFELGMFVAMELVEGETLRAWARKPHPWPEIVGMYLQAGRGLAAAHRAGIVHRDFKPDNAIVGADGRLRVVDFGLALTREDSEPTGPTWSEEGLTGTAEMAEMAGTPRYCPPEQLEGKSVDARADQYAFCASLWEALFGEPPFAGGDLLSRLAHAWDTVPRAPAGKGVPDRIVAALTRGLSPEVHDRFATMGDLLALLAPDPRKKRGLLVAAAFGAAVLAAALSSAAARVLGPSQVCVGAEKELAGVWNDDRRAAIERALVASGKPWAHAMAVSLSKVLDTYASEWTDMRRDACEATHVRRAQSEALLDRRVECLGERAAELRSVTMRMSEPRDGLLDDAPRAVYALTPLGGCADTAALLAPIPPPADVETRAQVERVRMDLADARAMKHLGQYADAKPLLRDLVARAGATHYQPLEAEALEELGDDLEELGEVPDSVDALHRALLAAERGTDRARAASVMVGLVWDLGMDQDQYARAHEYGDHAQALLDGLGGDPSLEAVLDGYQSAVLRRERKLPEALERARTTAAKRREVLGTDHPKYASDLNNIAAVLADLGQYDEMLPLTEEAIAILAHTLGEHHPKYLTILANHAAALDLRGRSEEARVVLERALHLLAEDLGPDHFRTASVEWSLAVVEVNLGHDAVAEGYLRHALGVAEHAGINQNVGNYAATLAEVLVNEGRFEEAEASARRAMTLLEEGSDNWQSARSSLAEAVLDQGRPAEAIALLEPTLTWLENEGIKRELGRARLRLSRALTAAKRDPARARTLATQAVEALALEPAAGRDLANAKTWLDHLGT
jgi:serine/threonine-protein kinase